VWVGASNNDPAQILKFGTDFFAVNSKKYLQLYAMRRERYSTPNNVRASKLAVDHSIQTQMSTISAKLTIVSVVNRTEIYSRFRDSATERAMRTRTVSIVSNNRLRQIDNDLCAVERDRRLPVAAAAADVVVKLASRIPSVGDNYNSNMHTRLRRLSTASPHAGAFPNKWS